MESKKPPILHQIPTHELGWVLVFDLDNTIVGEYYNLRKFPARKLPLNPLAVNILRYAMEERAKEKGEVAAIFLLTNNNDTDFIAHVDMLLKEELTIENQDIFDVIMDANHPMREKMQGGPMHGTHKKSCKDVYHCLREVKKTTEDLLHRLIFIDDQIYHQLAVELIAAGKAKQFIHVYPPFITPEPLLIPRPPSISSNTIIYIRKPNAFTVKPIPRLIGSAPWK